MTKTELTKYITLFLVIFVDFILFKVGLPMAISSESDFLVYGGMFFIGTIVFAQIVYLYHVYNKENM